jgi:hypothetical protein
MTNPRGVTSPFNLVAGVNVVVFQASDPNNPGVLTLYTSAGVAVLSMTVPGYSPFEVPAGGASYYFDCSACGASLVGAVQPINGDRM